MQKIYWLTYAADQADALPNRILQKDCDVCKRNNKEIESLDWVENPVYQLGYSSLCSEISRNNKGNIT